MDVVVANKFRNELGDLDIDIIKSISGEYEVSEIGEMFKNFFFDRMIIDVTAFKSYDNVNVYKRLVTYLDPDKIIFLLPEGSSLCTPNFLSRLISYGIYNFTTNINGVYHLLNEPNTLDKVEHIAKLATSSPEPKKDAPKPSSGKETYYSQEVTIKDASRNKPIIIGLRNVTASAGATTLMYMMKKELALVYGQENVLAIEVDGEDAQYFYDKRMISVKQGNLAEALTKYTNVKVILVDLNGYREDSFCRDVIYLIEPSTLKLNRLIRRNKVIFQNLSRKKVVLNQSILQNNDIYDFETEAGIKLFYNIPPLDERKRNSVIAGFLSKLGLINANTNDSDSGRIFGLFRR